MKVSGPANLPPAYGPAATPPTPPRPIKAGAPAAAGASSPSAEAPPGSDPALWAVLTPEERSFFERQAALGPLAYGTRHRAAPAGAPIGQRLDVRA